jgi:hypothetical protein
MVGARAGGLRSCGRWPQPPRKGVGNYRLAERETPAELIIVIRLTAR